MTRMYPEAHAELLQYALTELLNFVNTGECDGPTISMLLPFDDGRYRPYYANHPDRRHTPSTPGDYRGGPVWPSQTGSAHEALRRALRDQIQRLTNRLDLDLPTRPSWLRAMFDDLPPVEAATLTALWRKFDEVIGQLKVVPIKIRLCPTCQGFFCSGGSVGKPQHYCTPEHIPKRDEAAYSRQRRASERALRQGSEAAAARAGLPASPRKGRSPRSKSK